MHTLVTFVQLVLCWYNGFSQSVVIESDLVPENKCVGERGGDTCHNIVKRQIASKRVIAHLWILAVVSKQ